MWRIGKLIEKLSEALSIGISLDTIRKNQKALMGTVIVVVMVAVYVFCFEGGDEKGSIVNLKGQNIQLDNYINIIESNQQNSTSNDNNGINIGGNLENSNGQINISGGGDITNIDVNASQLDKENLISKKNADIEYIEGNYEAAFKICRELSKSGDSTALENLGYFYANGIGVTSDYEKASESYDAAIANGSKSALFNKFVLYVKNIRDYKIIIETLNIAYANKDEKIAKYVASFSDDNRTDMEILADIIFVQDDELENYIDVTFYNWRLLYDSFYADSALTMYSGNRKYEFQESVYNAEGRRLFRYRVFEKYAVNDELLKDEYQYSY